MCVCGGGVGGGGTKVIGDDFFNLFFLPYKQASGFGQPHLDVLHHKIQNLVQVL